MPATKETNSYICSVIDILITIGNLIESHIKHKIYIVGDFNFDFPSNHPGCILCKEFMRDYKQKFCDTLVDSTDSNMFTYCLASLNSRSFIDNLLLDSASYCDVVKIIVVLMTVVLIFLITLRCY